MTNKLTKNLSAPRFGEDVHALLKKDDLDEITLADLQKRVLAHYLNTIRHEFETNNNIRGILIKADPVKEAREDILQALDWVKHPNTPELFEKAVDILLDELQNMREAEPGAYLVDRSTGFAIKKLEDGDLFQPPDYIDENGQKKKSLQKVHPKITASLTMEKVGVERKKELDQRLEDPKYKYALAHVKSPNDMVIRARQLLESRGIKCEPMDGPNFELIEFGREHIHGEDQSINPAFHRLSNHASILASKIMKMINPGDLCWIDDLGTHKSSKQKWYTVRVWFQPLNQLN